MLSRSPLLMGILNTTPDSFYDQGKYFSLKDAYQRALKIKEEGADILDIGGESSRPGSEGISEQEEIKRTIPLIKKLRSLNIPISIDTTKPLVARFALDHGASMINDISGFSDPQMQEIAITYQCYICIMHMQNTPKTMQIHPFYKNGVISDLLSFFDQRINTLLQKGMNASNIIIDPGIGFGKTLNDNLEILNNIELFKKLGFPVLVGISRKAFMKKILQKSTSELLPATLGINTIILRKGIDIIRVHDVKEHKDILQVLQNFRVKEIFMERI